MLSAEPNDFTRSLMVGQRALAQTLGESSQATLARLLGAIADAAVVVDSSGTIQYASAAAALLFGRPLASLVGSPFGFPVSSVDPVDLELLQPDGSVRFVEMRAEALPFGPEHVWIAWLHDVTGRKQGEQRLLESQQFLALTLDALLTQIAILDADGTIVAVNAAWRALGARDTHYGVGSNYIDACLHALGAERGQAQAIVEGIQAVLDHQRVSFSAEYAIPGAGQDLWFALRVTRFSQSGATHIVIAHEDITSRRQAEAALRLFEAIVSATSEAILIAGTDRSPGGPQIVYANAAFEELSGYPRHELYGMPAARFLAPGALDDMRGWLAQAAGEGVAHGATAMIRPDRKRAEYEWSLSPIYGPDHQAQQFVAVLRDVTARRRAEQLDHMRSHVLELVAQDRNLTTILRELLAMVDYLDIPVHSAWVALPRELITHGETDLPSEQLLRISAAWGAAADASTPVTLLDAARLRAVASGQAAAVDQLRLDCAWVAPILSGAARVGTLVIALRATVSPQSHDLFAVEQIRQLMAIALDQRQRTQQLSYQAHYDSLTGLPNRVLFEERLQYAIEQSQRAGDVFGVMFIDLDRFKQINDTLGHSVGDQLLREFARRLLSCTRASDTLARRGGDEFMVVVLAQKDPTIAAAVAQRIIAALRLPFVIGGHELFVTASIGISMYPSDGMDVETLQRNADVAMYRVKSLSRNGFEFFSAKISDGAIERLRIENFLRRAIERDELDLAYQPLYDRAGQIIAVEALLRWQHPELGPIAPKDFIPIAEESGLIVSIGGWLLQRACHQARAWQRRGLALVRICVNVSALQFAQPNFAADVAAALSASGLDPQWLELELTESMLMGDLNEITRQLSDLRWLGVKLAIDDFGTGYSSLGYLQRMPISMLKIDRSFIQSLGELTDSESGHVAIVRAITTLAHSLQMQVTAEGVELTAQKQLLSALGCDRYQGFLFSHPLSAAAFAELLAATPAGGAPGRPAAEG